MDTLHAEKKAFLHRMEVNNGYSNSKQFYMGRIRFIMDRHSFQEREQMLGMVMSAAMCDKDLSVSELMHIVAQVEEAHKKSMEANFNDGWH